MDARSLGKASRKCTTATAQQSTCIWYIKYNTRHRATSHERNVETTMLSPHLTHIGHLVLIACPLLLTRAQLNSLKLLPFLVFHIFLGGKNHFLISSMFLLLFVFVWAPGPCVTRIYISLLWSLPDLVSSFHLLLVVWIDLVSASKKISILSG